MLRKISCCRRSLNLPFEKREERGTHSLGCVDKIKGRATRRLHLLTLRDQPAGAVKIQTAFVGIDTT